MNNSNCIISVWDISPLCKYFRIRFQPLSSFHLFKKTDVLPSRQNQIVSHHTYLPWPYPEDLPMITLQLIIKTSEEQQTLLLVIQKIPIPGVLEQKRSPLKKGLHREGACWCKVCHDTLHFPILVLTDWILDDIYILWVIFTAMLRVANTLRLAICPFKVLNDDP